MKDQPNKLENHDIPCEDCGSTTFLEWSLLPHELFNEVCAGGNGYLCFDCFCKRKLEDFISQKVREARVDEAKTARYQHIGATDDNPFLTLNSQRIDELEVTATFYKTELELEEKS